VPPGQIPFVAAGKQFVRFDWRHTSKISQQNTCLRRPKEWHRRAWTWTHWQQWKSAHFQWGAALGQQAAAEEASERWAAIHCVRTSTIMLFCYCGALVSVFALRQQQ